MMATATKPKKKIPRYATGTPDPAQTMGGSYTPPADAIQPPAPPTQTGSTPMQQQGNGSGPNGQWTAADTAAALAKADQDVTQKYNNQLSAYNAFEAAHPPGQMMLVNNPDGTQAYVPFVPGPGQGVKPVMPTLPSARAAAAQASTGPSPQQQAANLQTYLNTMANSGAMLSGGETGGVMPTSASGSYGNLLNQGLAQIAMGVPGAGTQSINPYMPGYKPLPNQVPPAPPAPSLPPDAKVTTGGDTAQSPGYSTITPGQPAPPPPPSPYSAMPNQSSSGPVSAPSLGPNGMPDMSGYVPDPNASIHSDGKGGFYSDGVAHLRPAGSAPTPPPAGIDPATLAALTNTPAAAAGTPPIAPSALPGAFGAGPTQAASGNLGNDMLTPTSTSGTSASAGGATSPPAVNLQNPATYSGVPAGAVASLAPKTFSQPITTGLVGPSKVSDYIGYTVWKPTGPGTAIQIKDPNSLIPPGVQIILRRTGATSAGGVPGFSTGTSGGTAARTLIAGDPQVAGVPNPEMIHVRNPGPDTRLDITPMFAFGVGKSKSFGGDGSSPYNPDSGTQTTPNVPAQPTTSSTGSGYGGTSNYTSVAPSNISITPPQNYLDQVQQARQNTPAPDLMGLTPSNVGFNLLDPDTQNLYYSYIQQKYGVPTAAQQFQQQQFIPGGLRRPVYGQTMADLVQGTAY